jgi:hypothetical protein
MIGVVVDDDSPLLEGDARWRLFLGWQQMHRQNSEKCSTPRVLESSKYGFDC